MAPSATATQPTRSGTATRKREILTAALGCFSSKGYDATTLADIRERASTGSIYHHFVNKAELAAELYLEGVRSTQEYSLRVLLAQKNLDDGIKSLVFSSLDWVQENPQFARFLFGMRHADFMEPVEAELERLNREALATASAWFRAHAGQLELKSVAPEVVRAIMFGPTMHYARSLLRRATGSAGAQDRALRPAEIARDKQQLAAAVHAALRPLLAAPTARKLQPDKPRKLSRKGSA
jgi:AcrR family transcriptional regulator